METECKALTLSEDQEVITSTSGTKDHSGKSSDEIEQKVWEVVRQVPGLNVGYGSVRLIIYIGKGNRKEVLSSATGVAKGLVETAAIVGCYFVSPVVAPIAAGALTGMVSDSIKGVAQVVVVMIENSSEITSRSKSADDKEKFLYKEIRNIPALGAAYSALRFPIYLVKRNKIEAVTSGVNSVFGGASSVIKCGAEAIHMTDKETDKVLQKLSQTLVPLISKKVLEKVGNKEITLDEGIKVVEALEVTCEAVENEVSRKNEDDANVHEVGEANSYESLAASDSVSQINSKNSRRCLPKICKIFKFKRTEKSEEKQKAPSLQREPIEQPSTLSESEAVVIVI